MSRPHALACAGGEIRREEGPLRIDRKGALRCCPHAQALHVLRAYCVPSEQSLSWHKGCVGGRSVAVRVQPAHAPQKSDTRIELVSCRLVCQSGPLVLFQ